MAGEGTLSFRSQAQSEPTKAAPGRRIVAGGGECCTSRTGLRHRGFSWQAPSPWHAVCLKGRARKGRVGCARLGGETWGQSAHNVAPWAVEE